MPTLCPLKTRQNPVQILIPKKLRENVSKRVQNGWMTGCFFWFFFVPWSTRAPQGSPGAPKWGPTAPRGSPRRPHRDPQRTPKGPQGFQKGPHSAPRVPQTTPQEPSKDPKRPPKDLMGPKGTPKDQTEQNGPQSCRSLVFTIEASGREPCSTES